MSNPAQPPGKARFEARPQQDTILLKRHPISHLETYEVSAHELDSIERESLGVGQDLTFASIFASIAATLVVALVLTRIDSRKVFDTFVAATIITILSATYCFTSYFRKRKATKSTIQEIRDRQLGPVGDEQREILPSELADLPSGPENPEPGQAS
jgi:hypothetical protein